MVLLAQIEKADKRSMEDKKTGATSALYQLVLSDKTKPSQFRASTFFVTYLTEEKYRAMFGDSDPVDERVTVAISEMAPMNAMIKVRGQVLKGWLSSDEIVRLQQVQEQPAQAAAKPEPVRKAA